MKRKIGEEKERKRSKKGGKGIEPFFRIFFSTLDRFPVSALRSHTRS